MSDEVKKATEAEYHFADSEPAVDPGTVFTDREAVKAPAVNQAALKKYLLIGGGIVLVLLAVVNFFSGMFGSTSEETPSTPTEAVAAVPTMPAQTVDGYNEVQPVAAAPAVPTVPAQTVDSYNEMPSVAAAQTDPAADNYNDMQQIAMAGNNLDQRFVTLSQQEQQISEQIEDILTGLAASNDRLDGLEKQLTDLSTRLSTINSELQQQKKQLTYLQTPTKNQVVTPQKEEAAAERVTYYIQAVVPGRAWLKSNKGGKTLTVREGSTVPGYGVVDNIEPQLGKVIMNSGESIIYSPDDS